MPSLEFTLGASELPRLYRLPPFKRRGGRPASVELVWHDTAGADLAADHVSLCEANGLWRLERASPCPGEAWPPATPPALLASGPDPAAFGAWPAPLMPIAGFRGERRSLALATPEPATVLVLDGVLRGVAQEQPACRIVLTGSAPVLLSLSSLLAETVDVAVPRWSLAAQAAALARGQAPAPRHTGGPAVPADATVGDALALVIGHLTDVIVAGVPAAASGETPEAVHAMRVAVRRLRSALSVFRRAAGGPALEALAPRLQAFATVLGQARDWDVFLDGTGNDVARALPDDPRVAAMLAAAAKRRTAAYTALRQEFASAGFRRLIVGLAQQAALRPWLLEADEAHAALLGQPAGAYGAVLLAKRRKRLLGAGPDIAALPAEDLHTMRKEGKRLRYAAEFFAAGHGKREARRFASRLAALQEALGHLNDGTVAAGLMAALPGGGDRGFAAGAVQGFAAARSVDARSGIAHAWRKFRKTGPFWA